MVKLSDMKVGERAVIKSILNSDAGFIQKLLALQLLPGSELFIEGKALTGCPIKLRLSSGSSISLRASEADSLEVDKSLCVVM